MQNPVLQEQLCPIKPHTLEKIEIIFLAKAEDTMEQCKAFTKQHRRCLKKSPHNSSVCSHHSDYYVTWFETHPPLQGWRLALDENEEYRFQIENGYVPITNEYLNTFQNWELNDYYEYLLHLPHIKWDTNPKMVLMLMLAFLNQYEGIEINRANLEYYFGRMFQNPSFCPANFLMRLIHVMDIKDRRLLHNFTQNRAEKILACILHHPKFSGWLYMNWSETLISQLPSNSYIPSICKLLDTKKELWRLEKQHLRQGYEEELMEIAMNPTRVLDWYMDVESKMDIQMRFRKGETIC